MTNPPSASGSVNSGATILAYLEEHLESHITPEHFQDYLINYPFILHQQPSPLYIVFFQSQCHFGEHQFILSEATLWYANTMYVN